MATKARWTFKKHYADTGTYPVNLAPWLASVASTIDSYTVTAPAGITVQHMRIGDVVNLTIAGGIVGKSYTVTVAAKAINERTMDPPIDITIRVHGRSQVVTDPQVVGAALVSGSAPTTGAVFGRPGAVWSYECLLVADAAGATAQFRIRVGNTPDCVTVFDTLNATVSATPSADGKYRGSATTDGNQPYLYHLAEIVSISGTNAIGSVIGVSYG